MIVSRVLHSLSASVTIHAILDLGVRVIVSGHMWLRIASASFSPIAKSLAALSAAMSG